MDELNRRIEDRDRALNMRLDQLERGYQEMSNKVTQLESSVNVVKLEQSHLKELFEARLRIIEKNQEIQIHKFDKLGDDITNMASDITKSPAGRFVTETISTLQKSVTEQATTIQKHQDWQKEIEGVLNILKWIGAGGLVALGMAILRLLKALP